LTKCWLIKVFQTEHPDEDHFATPGSADAVELAEKGLLAAQTAPAWAANRDVTCGGAALVGLASIFTLAANHKKRTPARRAKSCRKFN
jgi:hypothetical protein